MKLTLLSAVLLMFGCETQSDPDCRPRLEDVVCPRTHYEAYTVAGTPPKLLCRCAERF